MDENTWFNFDENNINTQVDELLVEWNETLLDPSYESMEKLIESKKQMFRRKVITHLNEQQFLKRLAENERKEQEHFDQMEVRFDRLEKLIIDLNTSVNKQSKSCSKMDDHINFVEGAYETLRSPLDYVTSKVNRLRGIEGEHQLPQIENK